ncbi:MAG: nicotinate-nucleotide--dimethylbenzimidazole phosphoribosyltransferase [Deltaproteobacteria bacterium DG_8]|nr:MAG: nicotinate-nucleotide--dimethylbenzimidazole phosphoribosyltransferase [Deltaproteobacteria bacterium DG_8]
MKRLNKLLATIKPTDQILFKKARKRLDKMAIPRGSLGRLEEFAQRIVAIRDTLNPEIKRKTVVIFAGDHGVVEEGVSAFAQDVTLQMVYNFIRGGAGINVLSRHVGADVIVVDIGVASDLEPQKDLLLRKVAKGTKNMAEAPAMSREEALKALFIGVDIADDLKLQKVDIIGTGDMGIGNTTPSSAITAVLARQTVEEVTGRGTGITDEMLIKKIDIIKESIHLNQPDPTDPIDVLGKLGGFEIAGIAGLIIGAASNRIPIVMDGFISTAAALVAVSLNPVINEYIFAAHKSQERGHEVLLEWLKQKPILDLSLRLGEGTGAVLGMSLIESGVKILREVLTFEEAGVKEAIK